MWQTIVLFVLLCGCEVRHKPDYPEVQDLAVTDQRPDPDPVTTNGCPCCLARTYDGSSRWDMYGSGNADLSNGNIPLQNVQECHYCQIFRDCELVKHLAHENPKTCLDGLNLCLATYPKDAGQATCHELYGDPIACSEVQ